MGMAKGIKQCRYIKPLTIALGWRTNETRTRSQLKEAGIYPYVDREKDALEFFIAKEHDLSDYVPFEEPAKAYHQQVYGKATHHTSLVVRQHSLPLADSSGKEESTGRSGNLIKRLTELITHKTHPHVNHLLYKQQIIRHALVAGGYPKPDDGTWDDEARALKILEDQGYPVGAFKRSNSRSADHLPAKVVNMPPQEMKLEIARLQQQVAELYSAQRSMQDTLKIGATALDHAVTTAYEELDSRRAQDPDARLTEGELLADFAHRQLRKNRKES